MFLLLFFVYVIIYYRTCFDEIFGKRYKKLLVLVIQCHAMKQMIFFLRFPTENCFIKSALFNNYSPKAK